MKKLLISILIFTLFSCKKENTEDTGLALGETSWNLHFKNNNTFSFFAESILRFKADKKVENYKSTDTISGIWKSKSNTVTITFSNGDIYTGSAISADSISGTLSASGNNGIWYAIKR